MNNEYLKKLNDILDIYSRLHPVGNKTARDEALQPIQYIIRDLEILVCSDGSNSDMTQYLDSLSTHLAGGLATRTTSGDSPEQHQIWADSAIRVLKRRFQRL